jgi:hypothetical protein
MTCALATSLQATTAKNHPNILILYADDMGYGDLAYQNPDSKIPTPHLDKLAACTLATATAHPAFAHPADMPY